MKILVAAALTFAVLCADAGDLKVLKGASDEPAQAPRATFESALKEVGALDRRSRELIQVGDTEGWSARLEEHLDANEVAINSWLYVAYRLAQKETRATPSNDVLRTAALHWSVATRRLIQDTLHTNVVGLELDSDCRGDLITDALMLRYTDAVLQPGVAGRELKVVAALTDIARQSACISTQQSNIFATALTASFEEVVQFLRLNGQEETVPLLVALASQPMLLFYDVEKWRGSVAPLSIWYSNYREILRQIIASRRHPAQWHQLWLYDRRTGMLVGYKPNDTPKDENDVHLGIFFQSVADPMLLGGMDCSFHEMVARGTSTIGYACAGASCQQKDALPGRVNNSPWSVRPGQSTLLAGGSTPLQTMMQDAFCPQAGQAPGRGGSGNLCSLPTAGVGATTAAQRVACVAAAAVQPGERQLRCLAEATGMCANPIERFTKQIQETAYAGVKLGKLCQITQSDGGLAVSPEDKRRELDAWGVDYYKQQWQEAYGKAQDARSEAVQEANVYNALFAQHSEALDDQQRAADAIGKLSTGPNRNDPGTQQKIDQQNRALNEAKAREKEIAAKMQASRDALAKKQAEAARLAKVEAEKKKAYEDRKKKFDDKYGSDKNKPKDDKDKPKSSNSNLNSRCVSGVGGCDNTCTAMSQAMKQVMSCLAPTQSSGTPASPTGNLRPGCDPRVCDPIDPVNPSNSALAQCFGSGAGGTTINPVQKQCWSMRCAGNTQATVGPTGTCVCSTPGTSGRGTAGRGGYLPDTCTNAGRCEDGSSPRFVGGACSCGGTAGTVQVPANIKQPGFNVPLPLPASVVRESGPEGFPVPR